MTEMNLYHRINVWRIANKCPVCGGERGYSQANPGGLEFNCDDKVHCGFSEFVPTSIIHNRGNQIDNARYEVLDRDNKVKFGWKHTPTKKELKALALQRIVYVKERVKMLKWERRQIIKLNKPRPTEFIKELDLEIKRLVKWSEPR